MALPDGRQTAPDQDSRAGAYPSIAPPPALRDTGPVWEPGGVSWQAIVDGVEEAVIAVDADRLVRSVNTVAERLLPPDTVGHVIARDTPLGRALTTDEPVFEIDHDGHRLRGRRISVGEVVVWYVRDVTEQTVRTDALLAERWRSAFLAEASRRLGATLHRDRTVRTAVTLAVPALGDCALVLLPGSRDKLSWFRYSGGDGYSDGDGHSGGYGHSGGVGDSGGDGAVAAGTVDRDSLAAVPALIDALDGLAVSDDPRVPDQLSTAGWVLPSDFGAAGSALVLPLPGHGEPVGVLVVARTAGRAGFEPVENHLARQYAARAGVAIAAAVLYSEQAQTADVLQQSLTPPTLPEVEGLVLGSAYRAARERLRIGGDFYDVFQGNDGTWTFILGDVCGKGVEAAVQTGQARQTLYALRLVDNDPVRLLDLLNEAILASASPQLTSLVVGTVHPREGGAVGLTLASGGHPPPLLLRAGGAVELVRIPGMIAGVLTDAQFVAVTVTLEPGDTLIMYSDGVTDARGGPAGNEFFGRDRLIAAVGGYAGMPAPSVAEHIEQVTLEWLGGREHDDIAVLAIQAPSPRGRRRHLRAVAT